MKAAFNDDDDDAARKMMVKMTRLALGLRLSVPETELMSVYTPNQLNVITDIIITTKTTTTTTTIIKNSHLTYSAHNQCYCYTLYQLFLYLFFLKRGFVTAIRTQ